MVFIAIPNGEVSFRVQVLDGPVAGPVARASFDEDGDEPVLLDDDNHELHRQRLTDPRRLRERGSRIGSPRPDGTDAP